MVMTCAQVLVRKGKRKFQPVGAAEEQPDSPGSRLPEAWASAGGALRRAARDSEAGAGRGLQPPLKGSVVRHTAAGRRWRRHQAEGSARSTRGPAPRRSPGYDGARTESPGLRDSSADGHCPSARWSLGVTQSHCPTSTKEGTHRRTSQGALVAGAGARCPQGSPAQGSAASLPALS